MSAPAAVPRHWVEVTARAAPRDVELVADALRASGAGVVAIEPAIGLSDGAQSRYREIDAPTTLQACFPAPFAPRERRTLRRRLSALPLSAPLPRLVFRTLEDDDWSQQWRRFWGVRHIGRRIVVRPSWEPYRAARDEVVVKLDPGRAFGTGEHETTQLCLEALERLVRPGSRVLDLGAGSGILAIAALRLGAVTADGLDSDADTVPVAQANAARNGVSDVVRFATGSLGERWPWPGRPDGAYDVVVSNISSQAIGELAAPAAAALAPGGVFVGSGYVAQTAAEVRSALRSAGLRVLRVAALGEWRCVTACGEPEQGA